METRVSNPVPRIYGPTAAARKVGCSPSWVHRLVRQGAIRPSLVSADGRRLFAESDVEALAALLRRRPTQEAA